MKTNLLHGAVLWTFLSAAALLAGCSDDDDYKDVDGQIPTLELTSDHIRTLTGYEFKITGKVSDKDGIRSIQLQNQELYLDKTIDLISLYPEPLYEYNLNYAFTIPDEISGESFTVKVIVTDLGGRQSQSDVLITMDGDYTLPELTVIYPSSGEANLVLSESTSLTLMFRAEDDKGLDYVEVSVPELEISERQVANEETLLRLEYMNAISFPSDKTGTYTMNIRAVDLLGNVAEKSCNVIISKVKDYSTLYLVDFEGTDSKLLTNSDVWGIPMPIERTGNFTYKARYYSAGTNTPVRFITSKTSFNVCFGDDKNNPGKLTGVAADAQSIILPEKGYYEITMNTEEGIYTVKKYTPEDEPYMEGSDQLAYNPDDGGRQEYQFKLGLVGDGFDGAPSWNPGNVYALHQDKENPYIYTTELVFSKAGSLDCTITPYHPWGWWISPSWRFDGSNERFVPGETVQNTKKYISKGTYTFVFDTHLCQSKLLKKNN